ncbi:MAG: hypothetical protein ACFCUU_04405 [Cyclobacteriaceae bacterium]
MKQLGTLVFLASILASCTATKQVNSVSDYSYVNSNPPITRSLFDDNTSTISEENIQNVLDGSYTLPDMLRVAFIKLESSQTQQKYYWADEQFLKAEQKYLDMFSKTFKSSTRVKSISTIPDILISKNPNFTNIREAAVRTQSDIAVIYTINSDLYSQYKLFSKTNIKAFATTQLIILDIRTGLVPFTSIVTKEFEDRKSDSDINELAATNRIKNEAVLLTIEEIGSQIAKFLENGR